jgi:hypothetical protein
MNCIPTILSAKLSKMSRIFLNFVENACKVFEARDLPEALYCTVYSRQTASSISKSLSMSKQHFQITTNDTAILFFTRPINVAEYGR